MKVLFDNVNFSSSTGPNSFAWRLANEFSLRGITIADKDDYDVALVFIEPTMSHKKPVVQRLDGIWFKPDQFERENVRIKQTYAKATHVIFQSKFDMNMCASHWGYPKSYSVIHNGISLEQETPIVQEIATLRSRYKKLFVSSANWHPQKRLTSNILLFDHIRKNIERQSCLIVLGNGPHYVSDPDIFYALSQPHNVCLGIYKMSDWMLHLAWLDHCPNVVVECLSVGTPVICSSEGGTRELLDGHSRGVVLNDEQKYNYELVDYDSPPSIDVTQLKSLPQMSKFNIDDLSIAHVADMYVNVLRNAKNVV